MFVILILLPSTLGDASSPDYLYINWNNGTYVEALGFSWPSERYCGPNKNGTLTTAKLRNISYYLLDWKSKNSNLNKFTVDAFLQANFLKARFNANDTVDVYCAPTEAQQANTTPYIVVMAGFVVALGIYFATQEELKKKQKIEKKIRKAIEKEEKEDEL